MKIVMLATGAIKGYEKNPRKNDGAVDAVAKSIKNYGFRQPIVVDGDGVIIVGHTRWKAAQKLGLKKVPVHVAKELTPEQAKAYRIADNKTNELATWDMDLLTAELKGLDDLKIELPDLGFSEDELGKILGDEWSGYQGETDADEVPPVPAKAKTKTGDLYSLGDHRCLCGDATKKEDVEKLMAGEKADMVFTAPPYGIGYKYGKHIDDKKSNENLVRDAFKLQECGKVWTPGLMNLARDIERFGKAKVAIWNKKYSAAGNGIGGASTWEPILIINPTNKKLHNDVIEIMTDRIFIEGKALREIHSCPKPVELYRKLVTSLSKNEQIIFDPFGGSGTTLIACEQTGRKCRMLEIDGAYCDVIIKRWEDFTGRKAILCQPVRNRQKREKRGKKS